MALAKIKTEEERARLDAIFAEIETAERGEFEPKPEPAPARPKAEQRLATLDCKEFVGNIRAMAKDGTFKTKWEKAMGKFILDTIAPMHAEINVLRNFATAVDQRLQKAEKSAREQDNHHYYKIFAEGVKTLLNSI